jgi:hypothetical protein
VDALGLDATCGWTPNGGRNEGRGGRSANRRRQAKEEAEREVAQYTAQREAKFKEKLSDTVGDSATLGMDFRLNTYRHEIGVYILILSGRRGHFARQKICCQRLNEE